MSQENVEALQAAFERYAHGDFSPIRALGDDFELVIYPEAPDVSTYREAEVVRAEMFRSRAQALEAAGLSE